MGVLEIYDGRPGEIKWVSRRYLISLMEIIDWCPGDILKLS